MNFYEMDFDEIRSLLHLQSQRSAIEWVQPTDDAS